VKLGLALPTTSADPRTPVEAAARAAAVGYDGVFSADHLFPPTGAAGPSLECFSILSAVAATVPGMAVGTLVARVTLRPVGMLAKQASMLDHLNGGRSILGLGTGDEVSRREHETFGIPLPPMHDRRVLLEETALACRALFDGTTWGGGSHVPELTGPLQPPGSPAIWLGGTSEAVVDMAARSADGWNGWALDLEGFRVRANHLREAAAGRDVDPTWGGIVLVGEDRADLDRLLARRAERGLSVGGVWTGTRDELAVFADDLAAAGCAWFVALVAGPRDRIDLVAAALGR
jgi:alkanesulfonate monooxygenase SsuD/methylene tetrahydromethanopterin reductase-like flavin-dependent oxidoreductase (luciferase family)